MNDVTNPVTFIRLTSTVGPLSKVYTLVDGELEKSSLATMYHCMPTSCGS